jgi:hypothetical protein
MKQNMGRCAPDRGAARLEKRSMGNLFGVKEAGSVIIVVRSQGILPFGGTQKWHRALDDSYGLCSRDE